MPLFGICLLGCQYVRREDILFDELDFLLFSLIIQDLQ